MGATIAYQAHTVHASDKSWDSLLIGMFPDKLALVGGDTHSDYIKAFEIRDQALRDALLLVASPIDLTALGAIKHAKL